MRALALLALLALNGCGFTAAVQGAGAQIGPAVSAIETDIYSVALAKYQAAQMFKAQMDGTVVLPPLPPPAAVPLPTASPTVPMVVMGMPVPSGTLPTGPTGK
jgi:hypothetical protein